MDNSEVSYIGKVKWFGDLQKEAQYGFIEVDGSRDYFVHDQYTHSKINEHDIVIFQIRKSKKDEKKFEAYNVYLVKEYNDLKILIDIFLRGALNYDYKNALLERINKLDPEGAQRLKEDIIKAIESKCSQSFDLKSSTILNITIRKIYTQISELYSNSQSSLLSFFKVSKYEPIRFIGWVSNFNIPIKKDQINNYYAIADDDLKKRILKSASDEQCLSLIELELKAVQSFTEEKTLTQFLKISDSIKVTKEKVSQILNAKIYDKSSIELRYKLWIENYYNVLTEDLENYILAIFPTFTPSVLQSTLAKFPVKQKIDFLKSLIDKKNKIFTEEGYEKYKIVFREVSLLEDGDKEKLIENLNDKLTPNYKVISWLDGNLTSIDVGTITESICVLPFNLQITCIRKLFECYRLKTIKFNVNDLEKMIDYNLSKKVDFNILLSLQLIILSVSSKIINARNLTGFVLKSLSSGIIPEMSNEFFEKCKGRALTEEITIDKKRSKKIKKTNKIPTGITFCEGRKAKKNNEIVKEDGFEFWWCKNKPCFQNELSSTIKTQWQSYTLFDLLLCIGENVDQDKHSYHLGVINKILLYINSLKCRKCKNWLSPAKQSNFAHDRVNLFECTQKECSEYQRKIYLSHCLNSKCENIVDNRNSEKCDHNWIICNYCLACCSTVKISKRKYILDKTGQETNNAAKGHDETEEIFCFKCGSKFNLSSTEKDDEKYKKCLDWLEKHKSDKNRIVKSGKTKNGKLWYLIKKLDKETVTKYRELLKRFHHAGFNVKPSKVENLHLISEPNFSTQAFIKCSNKQCNNVINLDDLLHDDRDRLRAMLYHKKIKNIYAKKFNFQSKQS